MKEVIIIPRYDRQDPVWGQGAGSGRGLGPCGRGYGFHRFHRGLGRRFMKQWTKEDEIKALDEEEAILKEELTAVEQAKKELHK